MNSPADETRDSLEKQLAERSSKPDTRVAMEERHEKAFGPASQAPAPVEHIAQFFAFSHLPEKLQAVSAPFAGLADHVLTLPRNPERTVALRKLLEAKDAAVRAAIAVMFLLALLLPSLADAQLPRMHQADGRARRVFSPLQLNAYLSGFNFTNTRIVDQGGHGDFTTIAAAITYVNTQSPDESSRWLIVVYGGVHGEDPGFTLPDYVSILFEGSADEQDDSSAFTTYTKNSDYSLNVRGGTAAAFNAKATSNNAWGGIFTTTTGSGAGGVKGIGNAGRGGWFTSTTNTAVFAQTSSGGKAALFQLTGASANNAVEISRLATTGNLTGNLLSITDSPSTAGTVSGDLINAQAGDGSTTSEVFAVDRTGKVRATALRVTVSATPASASAACTTGDIAMDTGFFYRCTATNTWKRVALATW